MYIKSISRFYLLSLTIVITGCSQWVKPQVSTSNLNQQISPERLERCQKELTALKQVNPQVYSKQNESFNKLMAAANQYSSVRNDANQSTVLAMDSLYQYRVVRLCEGISVQLFDALSLLGEQH